MCRRAYSERAGIFSNCRNGRISTLRSRKSFPKAGTRTLARARRKKRNTPHCDVAHAVALALALRLADQPRAEARDRRDADRADQARRGPAPRYQGDLRVARGSDAAKASERKLEKARRARDAVSIAFFEKKRGEQRCVAAAEL